MADRKRRGEDAVNDRLDDDLVESGQDDVAAADDELLDDDLLDDEPDVDLDEKPARAPSRRGAGRNGGRRASLTKDRPAPSRRSTRGKAVDKKPNVFARILNFFREVVAELRKVIWPTRKELLTYTAVVVVFVSIMLTIVGLLDYGLAKAVLWVFGDGGTQATPPGQSG